MLANSVALLARVTFDQPRPSFYWIDTILVRTELPVMTDVQDFITHL